jgi:hypothetical protein
MKKISDYLLKKQTNKHIKRHESERRFITYEKARTICLLFESPSLNIYPELVEQLKAIKRDGKEITVWGYVPVKQMEEYNYQGYNLFLKSEIDFLGRPKRSFFRSLYGQKFDMLIDISQSDTLTMAYLSLNITAKFKVGIKKENTSIYDFMLGIESISRKDVGNSPIEKYLLEQILFYLKEIRSND